MIINLEDILNGKKENININTKLNIPDELLVNSEIVSLKELNFIGKIKRLVENLTLEGNLIGIMILKDDITLENIEYKFNINIEEEIEEIYENKIDLVKNLWQYIQVEVPSKITNNKSISNKQGKGWRFITEEDNKNYAFKDLEKLIKERSQ